MKNNYRVADAIVSIVKAHGVEVIFGVVGGNAMHLNDAVRISGLKFIPFHNEQSAAIAAEAYARSTGKLSVCLVTSGPGASNTTTGVAGMYLDSVPVLVIAGQAKSTELVRLEMGIGVRQVGTFELPMVAVLEPITKASHCFNFNENIYQVMTSLIKTCISGRPGPVYLEVPLDLQSLTVSNLQITDSSSVAMPHNPIIENPDTFINIFLKELELSKSPLIIVGHGIRVSNQARQFKSVASMLGIPIVTTQIAKDLIHYDSPLFVGHVGVRGDRPGNFAVQEADLILTIGTSLQQQTIGYDAKDFAPNAKLFVVDYQNSVSAKNSGLKFENLVNVDCENFLARLKTVLTQQKSSFRFEDWKRVNSDRKVKYAVHQEPHDFSTPAINMYEFVQGLNDVMKQSRYFVTDAGLCFYILGQALQIGELQRYLVSGGLGSMGWALPASIGAASVGEGSVVCVIGDGSMQMCVQELATVVNQNLNCKIFVINNNGYASIRNTQKSFFGLDYLGCDPGSGLSMPVWKIIAEAYKLQYVMIADRNQLREQLEFVQSYEGPILIEVVAQEIQQIMPTIVSVRGDDGGFRSNPLHRMSPEVNRNTSELHYN
ncbi:IlvB Thiamine pyrophosphate-requiring enzymes [acetolactate synthase, pyruvate dehydrogenase (cytochrome), glyoxylate carboligase, phosphonopyruvate decarboxylase] [Candidatus Nanopelagicaceae bacterium]